MSAAPAPGLKEPLPLPKILINENDTDSKDVPEHLHRQQSLDAAYEAAYSKTELSNTQKKADRFLDTIDLSGISTRLANLDSWYATNGTALATVLTSSLSDAKSINIALNSYDEISELLIQGLDALSQVHVFVAVAAIPFKVVVMLDKKRRDNNKKVLAVKVQMQDMMIALFQLRGIRDPQEVGSGGITIEDRFGTLMKTIAKDIDETASACNLYLKKGFLAKTIKSKKYEDRLATYAANFTKHREDIALALQIHTARGVESANTKLDDQGGNLKSIGRKLDEMKDTILSVFRKLDTPRERDVQKFIEEKGGAKTCIENEELLHQLVEKSGEGVTGVLGQQSGETWMKAKDKVQTAMRKELAEDVEQAFKRNFAEFEKKLGIQLRQLSSIAEDSLRNTQSILTAVTSGAHDRISDDDLRDLWKDMGWKSSSIKAKYVVFALHDYLTDKLSASTRSSSPIMSPIASEIGSPIISSITGDLRCKNDQWTLKYLNIAHLQPILEAIDDDATGFITIKEINTFTTKFRPSGWTLPQWIAYWAKGWHISVDRYRKKIRMILSKMYDTFPGILPANRETVAEYLQHRLIYKIDKLLQSTRALLLNTQESSELRRLTEEYTKIEEARLGANLVDVQYDIDGISTVSLITGPGCIERYIYPVLYLLLRHHLMVIRLSTRFVLDQYEMDNLLSSLWNLFSVVEQRIQSLASIFQQSNLDVAEKLENFAFGMFKLLYSNPEKQLSNNFISDYINEDPTIEDQGAEPIMEITPSILRYTPPNVSGPDMHYLPSDFSEDAPEDPIQGQWTGHLYDEQISVVGLIQFIFDSVKDGVLTGKAATSRWDVDFSGNIKEKNKVYIRLTFDDQNIVDLTGELDIERGTIEGRGKYTDLSGDDQGGDEENKDKEAVSQGEDKVVLKEGTDGGCGSTLQSHETDTTEKLHGDPADPVPDSNESDARHDDLQAPDSSGSADPEPEDYYHYTFIFRRTPASLCRFLPEPGDRRDQPAADESAKGRAQARWKFVCASVRDIVIRKSFPWTFLRERFAERRRFLDLAIKERCMTGYSPRASLSEEERKEWYRLQCSICPMDSRYYYSSVDDEIDRRTHFRYYCDSCGRPDTLIFGSRFICLTCMGNSDSFTDTVDLCMSCIDASYQCNGVVHGPSHVLLKFDTMVLDGRLRGMVPAARSMVVRIRQKFRTSLKDRIEPVEKSGFGSQSRKETSVADTSPHCQCCGKPISLPCWVCLICSIDVYVCGDCDAKKKEPLKGSSHVLGEPLLRVSESDPLVETVPVEVKLANLERRFDKVDQRLIALEDRVESQLSAIGAMLKEHFSSSANGNNLEGSD